MRASVVNSASLAEVAAELEVGWSLMLGKGEDQSGGREKPSILADATEALIGAVYIDRGWGAAESVVMSLFGTRIEAAAAGPGGQDYKTRLQELSARIFDQLPRYSVRDEGPDHAKSFEATVYLQGSARGSGWGRSKKQAEQAAARVAWQQLLAPAGDGPVGASGDDGPVGPSADDGPVGASADDGPAGDAGEPAPTDDPQL